MDITLTCPDDHYFKCLVAQLHINLAFLNFKGYPGRNSDWSGPVKLLRAEAEEAFLPAWVGRFLS